MDELIKLFNNTFEIAKSLKKLNDSIKDTTVRTLILSLNEMLLDLKEQILTNKTEMLEYKEKIQELQKQLTLKESIIYDDKRYPIGFYYSTEDKEKNQPYCPTCKEHSDKHIHLRSYKPPDGGHYFECTVCKVTYTVQRAPQRSNVF